MLAAVISVFIATAPADKTCVYIRQAVKTYGVEAVVRVARMRGYSEMRIRNEARRCLGMDI